MSVTVDKAVRCYGTKGQEREAYQRQGKALLPRPKLQRALFGFKRQLLQVNLASLLARDDTDCLLVDLKALQNEGPSTLSTKAEIQALCRHMQKVCFAWVAAQFEQVQRSLQL